jgi:glyoxylase-like metal-dependent hydrolase (beta-lactamase superfamily II)
VIEQVVEGVWWIPGKDRFFPDSHVYVVGKPGSGDFSLIDCGLNDMGSYKLEEIDAAGIPRNDIKRVIMTHTHVDHIGCLPELRAAIPGLEVWVHKNEADHLERGDYAIVFGNGMFESVVRSQYNLTDDYWKMPVDRKLEGGEILTLGGLTFKVLHIPGHSAGSIGLLNEEHKLFMSGDTIYADGAIGRFDLVSANPSDLKRSLDLIAGLGIEILLPCHNRIVKSGAESMIRETVRQWTPLLGGE